MFVYIYYSQCIFLNSHKDSDVIWVKKFDGKEWEYKKLAKDDKQEDLVCEILGSREPAILIEGNKNSIDSKIYSLIYPNRTILCFSNCGKIKNAVKSFNNINELHHSNVIGIIDRDFNCDDEIETLERYNIYATKLRDIENIFIIPEFVRMFEKKYNKNNYVEQIVEYIKNNVIDDAISGNIKHYINKYITDFLCKKNSQNSKKYFDDLKCLVENINFLEINKKSEFEFEFIFDSKGKCYDEILTKILERIKIKNCYKSIINDVFEISNVDDYTNYVYELFNNKKLLSIVRDKYFPNIDV